MLALSRKYGTTADHAEQAQQTRGGTQYRLGNILSRRFKTQVGLRIAEDFF
jgi:hypothetical protein